MTYARFQRTIGTLTALGTLTGAYAGWAQVPAPPSPPSAPASTADGQAGSEDRIFALVQAGKCGQAKAAAERMNDTNLAEQIGTMCGLKATGGSAAGVGGRRGAGGGGGPGGAMSAGRRGGGG